MRKFIFLTNFFIFLCLSCIFAKETFPVKLRYGENVLSIIIVNNTPTALKTLTAKIDENKLPAGISISVLNYTIDAIPNEENNQTLKLKILVTKEIKEGNYTAPLIITDALNNSWNYSLDLELINSVVTKFELNQNYPNPFNGTTNIKYSIPVDNKENVKLLIYDLVGQQIKVLVDEKQEGGTYNVIWNGKDEIGNSCSSGIYFYKIKTNSFQAVKKMIILE